MNICRKLLSKRANAPSAGAQPKQKKKKKKKKKRRR